MGVKLKHVRYTSMVFIIEDKRTASMHDNVFFSFSLQQKSNNKNQSGLHFQILSFDLNADASTVYYRVYLSHRFVFISDSVMLTPTVCNTLFTLNIHSR